MVRVKICGMMSRADVALCAGAGAHALGFVVEYPAEVPWNLTVGQAAGLVAAAPPFVCTCMVAAGAPERVLSLAERVRPHVVQLHGEETLAETARMAAALGPMGIRVVKALRTTAAGELLFEEQDPGKAARALAGSGVHALLVDACSDSRPGGSGRAADADIYRAVAAASELPVILAGGLRADNVAAVAARGPLPFAVDVLTGVEDRPGVKNPQKVRALLEAASALR